MLQISFACRIVALRPSRNNGPKVPDSAGINGPTKTLLLLFPIRFIRTIRGSSPASMQGNQRDSATRFNGRDCGILVAAFWSDHDNLLCCSSLLGFLTQNGWYGSFFGRIFWPIRLTALVARK
jgi:hypothetical protein